LKGATGNFDLPALTALLERIETLAPSTDLDAALRDLPAAAELARAALITALGDLQSSLNQAAQ
jgi:hypothetical protein